MKKYVHIGYPKNFSTSLQRNFFSSHPQLYHLGIGINDNLGYRDELLSSIFEVYLKYSKSFKFNLEFEKIKAHLNNHIQIAAKEGHKGIGLSSEHLSFSFTHDGLDFQTKMNRLRDVFGEDLDIIMIIRNQVDVLKSLYRESVRVGLIGSFEDYIYNLYKFQDRNYLFDFSYDLVYSELKKIFPEACIHVLVFEELRESSGSMVLEEGKNKLIKQLSSILEIDYQEMAFEHFNEALKDGDIVEKEKLNRIYRHDLGRELTFSAEVHRQKEYFSSELGLLEDEVKTYEDVLTKRRLIEQVKSNGSNKNLDLSYDCNKLIGDKVLSSFADGNQRLSEKLSLNLSGHYFKRSFS
jgi:hypothetical protein